MIYKKIGELCRSYKKGIKPVNDEVYTLFSLPAFDNNEHPEIVNGSEIKSNKLAVTNNMILFNKLNVKYRRVWNIKTISTKNNLCSTEFIPLIANDGIDQDYLYYCLISDDVTYAMHAARKGTSNSQQRIDESILFSHSIPVPDLEVQKKIASLLGSIDDKIRINKQINDNLLQQVMTIFTERFPTIMDGDHLVSEYILPKRGKGLLSKDAIYGSIPVVAGGLEPSTYHNVSNTKSPVITISASGANAGFVRLWNQEVWSSDSSFIDNSVTEFVYFWYALLKARQQEIFDSQTGSAQPHIYPKHIGALKIPSLDAHAIKQFNDDVRPLFDLIGKNEEQNTILSSMRDNILPKLMSGELNLDSFNL